ncbi:MAG: glycosyltransferase [Thermoleophilia bacterium]|nr:glycosyltransferase [Thermoleophilia bacterium]MDQ3858893.1 glycosyltransferase [Actinomycetota bacterium]
MPRVDVLVPTYRRPAALAVTLAGLVGQSERDFRVVVSDQSEEDASTDGAEANALVRILFARGQEVVVHRRRWRRGMAEQRQFLLDRARSPFVLFLDDDVLLLPDALELLLEAIEEERCGFVGFGLVGASFADDVRRDEEEIAFWDGPVRPERVRPGDLAWERHRLHNAANLLHLERRLGARLNGGRRYKVAWIGGCVLYDVEKLRAAGGFGFWRELPREHAGEDVLAQIRVMERFGGCGLLPSRAYHQELATTVRERSVDAPRVLPVRSPA